MITNRNVSQVDWVSSLRKITAFLDKHDSENALAQRLAKSRYTLKFLLDILIKQSRQGIHRLSVDTTINYVSKCTGRARSTIRRHLLCLQHGGIVEKSQNRVFFKGQKHATSCLKITFNCELFDFVNVSSEIPSSSNESKLSTIMQQVATKEAVERLISKLSIGTKQQK